MAKRVHSFGTPLDREVEAFLRRVGGSDSPAAHVKAYSVERNNGAPHMITVQFIADAEFDAPTEAGWLSPDRVAALRELADKGWPETVYDAETVGAMVLRLLDGEPKAAESL